VNVKALEKVAAVYKEQGNYEEALELYQKAMATDSRLCIDLDKTKVSQPGTVTVILNISFNDYN
jgi:hypothetical protein